MSVQAVDSRPHLRDVAGPGLGARLAALGLGAPTLSRRLRLAIHGRGATTWSELPVGRAVITRLREAFEFGPLLEVVAVREAGDGTRKLALRCTRGAAGDVVESVVVRNRAQRTLCVSSQVGCAMGCAFCATAALGLRRNLTAGEITEQRAHAERAGGERASDVVFMGMGEPLHNYDAVVAACGHLNQQDAAPIARKRITISTVGLPNEIRRLAREPRPWRLNLSLHSAVQEVRERLVPLARRHPLSEVLDALREYQRVSGAPFVTLQYVVLPGVNTDEAHVEALRRELTGLRCILNVIPWNEVALPAAPKLTLRPPTWDEVREFTTRLRDLRCPVKIRYSAGKRDGMGCGQLSAETVPVASGARHDRSDHMNAPPGIFTR